MIDYCKPVIEIEMTLNPSVPIRVTRITGRARIHIPAHTLVVIIRLRIRMANGATENRIIAGIGVAIGALIPGIFM